MALTSRRRKLTRSSRSWRPSARRINPPRARRSPRARRRASLHNSDDAWRGSGRARRPRARRGARHGSDLRGGLAGAVSKDAPAVRPAPPRGLSWRPGGDRARRGLAAGRARRSAPAGPHDAAHAADDGGPAPPLAGGARRPDAAGSSTPDPARGGRGTRGPLSAEDHVGDRASRRRLDVLRRDVLGLAPAWALRTGTALGCVASRRARVPVHDRDDVLAARDPHLARAVALATVDDDPVPPPG